MAANQSDLKQRLVRYIDNSEEKEALRPALKSSSVTDRYQALLSCKGTNGWTSVTKTAVQKDTETLKCMLDGLSSSQLYEVMKFRDDDGDIALHEFAGTGDSDTIVYVLHKLSAENRFNLLKTIGRFGFTPAHHAANQNKLESLQLLLTSVTPEQQRELLAIKNDAGNLIRNLIFLPDLSINYFAAKVSDLKTCNQNVQKLEILLQAQQKTISKQAAEQGTATQSIKDTKLKLDKLTGELGKANQRVQDLEQVVQKQETTNTQQDAELGRANKRVQELEQSIQTLGDIITQQAAELTKANQRVQPLEQLVQTQGDTITQQAAALQRLTEMQEDMQRALEEMDKFNRRCFSTGDTGDQEHDEQPYQRIQ